MLPTNVIASMAAKQSPPASVSFADRSSSAAAAISQATTVPVMRNGSTLAKRLYMSFSARTCAG
jgi:hypothetical protein